MMLAALRRPDLGEAAAVPARSRIWATAVVGPHPNGWGPTTVGSVARQLPVSFSRSAASASSEARVPEASEGAEE